MSTNLTTATVELSRPEIGLLLALIGTVPGRGLEWMRLAVGLADKLVAAEADLPERERIAGRPA